MASHLGFIPQLQDYCERVILEMMLKPPVESFELLPASFAQKILQRAQATWGQQVRTALLLRQFSHLKLLELSAGKIDDATFEVLRASECRTLIFNTSTFQICPRMLLPQALQHLEFRQGIPSASRPSFKLLLEKAPQLKTLDLGAVQVEQLPSLAKMERLRSFTIEYSLYISGEGGRKLMSAELGGFLKQLPPSLDSLQLRCRPAWLSYFTLNEETPVGLEPGSLTQLRSLTLEQFRGGNDAQWSEILAAAPHIEELQIIGTGSHFTGEAFLAHPGLLQTLKTLRIHSDDRAFGPTARGYNDAFRGSSDGILCKLLSQAKSLQTLDLDMPIASAGGAELPKESLSALNSLRLVDGRGRWSWKTLAQVLMAAPHLNCLSLDGFQFEEDEWLALIDCLSKEPRLRPWKLELRRCTALATGLAKLWPGLGHLSLSHMNLVSSDGATASFRHPIHLKLDSVTGDLVAFLAQFQTHGLKSFRLHGAAAAIVSFEDTALWAPLEICHIEMTDRVSPPVNLGNLLDRAPKLQTLHINTTIVKQLLLKRASKSPLVLRSLHLPTHSIKNPLSDLGLAPLLHTLST